VSQKLPLSQYKDAIMQSLLDNDNIVKILNSTRPDFFSVAMPAERESLLYKNIHPYRHIPKIQEVADTFISMGITLSWDGQNKSVLRNLNIYIYVLTHQTLQRTAYGATRTDMLASEIQESLSKLYGVGLSNMYLSSLSEQQLAESEYNGVIMQYTMKDINEKPFFD